MPNINVNRLMSFDHGIDDIVYARKDDQAAQGLPDRRNLTPSDDGVRTQLTQLLEKPNTGSFLEEALRPSIENRDLLLPSHFADALGETLTALSNAADAGVGDSRTLNRAVRLLKEETSLRDLVAMYRSALYQG
jgi:type III secretion protein X